MKRYFAAALLLASCRPDQPASTTAEAPAAASAAASAPAATAASPAAVPTDTLHVADSLGHPLGVLRLRPSTQAAFGKLSAALPARGPDLPQRVLGHVVVSPGGVVVVSAQHLPGARVRVSRGALVADGQRRPALHDVAADARHLTQHLTQHLEVPVAGVVAVVGAERLGAGRPGAVTVLSAARLVRWLQRRPRALDPETVDAVAAHLRALGTSPQAQPAEHPEHPEHPEQRFERLHARVRTADRVRRGWQVLLAVAASSGVVVALLDVLG